MIRDLWVSEGDNLRCTLHGEIFSKLRSCGGCSAGPAPSYEGDASEDAPEAVPPSGCETTAAHERKFTRIAKAAEREAKKLARAGVNPSTVAKLFDVAIKARRNAADFAREREDKAHTNSLKAHERRMKSGGDH